MPRGVCASILLSVVAVFAGLAALGIGPDYILFDVLIPLVPGEKVQAMGVYAAQALCQVIRLRKALPVLRDGVLTCGKGEQEDSTMRVIFAVNKGGSVFGARLAYEVAWACGWCPGMAHNEATIWPPQPDYLPSYKSDVYIAIPMAKDWETYAFQNASRKVQCAVLVREPFKRLKSLLQYAWEGGEPALWGISSQLKDIPTWKERIDWAWKTFAKGTMVNTHEVLMKAVKRKECTVIKFEKFAKDFDAAFLDWMQAWNIRDEAIPTLAGLSHRHDLNRLTPEQRAAHHHVSGKSLSTAEVKEMERAMSEHVDLQSLMQQQLMELGY